MTYPLTLGSGQRLFPDGSGPTKLELTGTQAFDGGIVRLSYRPAPGPTSSKGWEGRAGNRASVDDART